MRYRRPFKNGILVSSYEVFIACVVLLHLTGVALLAQLLKISQKESFQNAFPFSQNDTGFGVRFLKTTLTATR